MFFNIDSKCEKHYEGKMKMGKRPLAFEKGRVEMLKKFCLLLLG